MGVRIAVGAAPRDVVRLFIRRGLRPIWIGGIAGLAASIATTRVLSQWLYGVAPLDAVSIVAAIVAVAVAGFLATYLPARRAAFTDPAAAFRCD